MNPFEMIVLVVLIAIGAGVINNYLKVKAERESEAASDADLRQVFDDVARLKERVRVLEEIVTDQERQLADEIRKLA